MSSMLKLDSVSKYYRSDNIVSRGMYQVSLEFNIGEFVAVTGESGSGKSTLLNVISGLDGYDEGEMYLYGEETSHYTVSDFEKYRANYIGFIFQNYNIIDQYTVFQNVMLALEVQNYPKKDRRKRALELINSVGLKSRTNSKASKLSGGEKQRCVIARALAKDTPIICCDEPTGNLDSSSASQVITLLHEISKSKLIIIVTHNFSEVEKYATRKITMSDGTIIEDNNLINVEINSEKIEKITSKMNILDIFKTSILNFFSQPKKASLQLSFLIFFLFIIILIYGNAVYSIRDSALGKDLEEYVVLVERQDGKVFEKSDVDYLNKIKEVNNVYTDIDRFFYNKNLIAEYNTIHLTPIHAMRKIELTNGSSLPKNNNDILLPQNFLRSGYIVGSEFILTEEDGSSWYSEKKIIKTYKFVITGFTNNNENLFYVSDEFLQQTGKFSSTIVLSINGDNYFDSLKSKIDLSTYKVLYPYRSTSEYAEIISILSIIGIAIPIIIITIIFILIYQALSKNMMNARKKDFAIMRSIGANKMNLSLMIVFEQLFICILAFIVILLVILIGWLFIPTFSILLKYIKISDYIIIFLFVVLFGIYLGTRFNKKFFGYSVIQELTLAKED